MLAERWRRIESLFHEALEKNPAVRARFLEDACSSDQTLRREVESLLEHESLVSGFLESDGAGATKPRARNPDAADKHCRPRPTGQRQRLALPCRPRDSRAAGRGFCGKAFV